MPRIALEGLEIYVYRDTDEQQINICIHTDDLGPEDEWEGGNRIPRLCVRVNEEECGIRINPNGKWTGENIATPLEQIAEQAE